MSWSLGRIWYGKKTLSYLYGISGLLVLVKVILIPLRRAKIGIMSWPNWPDLPPKREKREPLRINIPLHYCTTNHLYIFMYFPEAPKCPEELFDGVLWSSTAAGGTDVKPCPNGASGKSNIKCFIVNVISLCRKVAQSRSKKWRHICGGWQPFPALFQRYTLTD